MEIKKRILFILDLAEKGIKKAKGWINKPNAKDSRIAELEECLTSITKVTSLEEAVAVAKSGLKK